jgi:hypothetical protein
MQIQGTSEYYGRRQLLIYIQYSRLYISPLLVLHTPCARSSRDSTLCSFNVNLLLEG